MLNQAQTEIVKKNWSDIRGEVQKNWSKLTFDDIERTKGSVKAISTLVQQKHGVSSEQFDKKFSDIVDRLDPSKEKISEDSRMSPDSSESGRESRDSDDSRLNS